MWAHIKFIDLYSVFQLKTKWELYITKGEKSRFSQNTDSPKTDHDIQRRVLFTFLKAVFGMILLLHSTFVLV